MPTKPDVRVTVRGAVPTMPVTKEEVVGRSTGKATITVERGPVTMFAAAVTHKSPIYRRRDAATEAGFDDIPVPPTYFFSAGSFWGAFSEEQPPDATPATNPTMEIIGSLMATGGIVLHGEQEFTYHRPIVVGQTLHSAGK